MNLFHKKETGDSGCLPSGLEPGMGDRLFTLNFEPQVHLTNIKN